MRYHAFETETGGGTLGGAPSRTCEAGCIALACHGSSARCESCGRELSPEEACRTLCRQALDAGTVTSSELLSFLETRLGLRESDRGSLR